MSRTKFILALDVDSFNEAMELVKELKGIVDIFKVGSQLFTSCGPALIDAIHDEASEVFLDLKYYDIPNTVALAAAEACRKNVYMFDVHTSGGTEMMRRVIKSVSENSGERKPLIFGITVLTSMDEDQLAGIGVRRGVKEQVQLLAKLAQECGLSGVVASGYEIQKIKRTCGHHFLAVVPGIRPATAIHADQKRVMTPRQAVEQGADFIVVGRPVLEAGDRKKAAQDIKNELEQMGAN